MVLLVVACGMTSIRARQAAPSTQGPDGTPPVDFNRQIRPLLSDRCFRCPGPDASKRKAKLRLDRVDKTYSVANIVAGSQLPGVPPPDQGDEIALTEPNKQLSGKVAYLDSKTQLVAVDLRQHDGVKTGQRFGVYRLGKQVGTVEIMDIHPWGSWAKPDAETKHEDIQRGDIIRIIEEKK